MPRSRLLCPSLPQFINLLAQQKCTQSFFGLLVRHRIGNGQKAKTRDHGVFGRYPHQFGGHVQGGKSRGQGKRRKPGAWRKSGRNCRGELNGHSAEGQVDEGAFPGGPPTNADGHRKSAAWAEDVAEKAASIRHGGSIGWPGPQVWNSFAHAVQIAMFVLPRLQFNLSNLLVDIDGMIQSNSQIALLSKLMDVAHLRQEVIAHNVANVNTPGHQCLEVRFEDALRQALTPGRGGHAGHVAPRVAPGVGGIERADGNNVDIDLEMGRLQKNSLLFELYSQVLSVQLAQYRSAIQGH